MCWNESGTSPPYLLLGEISPSKRSQAWQRNTPNIERLAAGGLKYNRFHTTALCSPTRSALLIGRNHHSVGMGTIAELATSAAGTNSIWPSGESG
jgi:arylsulfatase A-like enzyme